jgi:hypothetical protein
MSNKNKKTQTNQLDSLSLSLPSIKSDFSSISDLKYDTDEETRKSIFGKLSIDTDPRLLSLGKDTESKLSKSFSRSSFDSSKSILTKSKKTNPTESIRYKLYEVANKNQEDDLSQLYNDYDLDSYDTKTSTKSKRSKVKRRTNLKRRVSKKNKKVNASKQVDSNARRLANIYMNTLKRKLANKSKDNTYKLIEKELEQLEGSGNLADLIKISRINFLLEDIHAKFDVDDAKVKLNYPILYDKDFNEKIYQKYEFYKNKIRARTPKSMLDNLEQNEDIFKLANTQKFLKNYMSPLTPYRGLLIFHGVGVGKTCAAISIVEQFKDEILEEGKKIYVIRDKEIRKQLFNINRVRTGNPDFQCTGSTYVNLINEPKTIEKCEAGELDWCVHLENMVRRTTKRFYDFNGPLQWANKVNAEIRKAKRNVPPQYQREREITKIRKMFSDSIIIVDEAHNIKDTSDKESHIVPPVLTKVATYAKNLRLILLSATPMFNSFVDLIPLINYLLVNDKRAKIKERDIFTKNGDFIPGGEQKLVEKTRGYVSYLRGEDPLTFPLRFSSAINETDNLLSKTNWPKFDIYGNKLTKHIQYLDIVGCSMSSIQYKIYNSYIEKRYKQNLLEKASAAFSSELQIGNIVYQELSKITNDPKECFGERGFLNIMEKVEGKTQYRFKDPESADIFKLPTMKKYSAKIAEIMKSIEKAEGIVFVYSQYESAGILPLAFALEIAGYTKYKSKHMPLLDYRHKKPTNGHQYLIISGKENLRKGDAEYIKKSENMIYEPVKVILGTKAASEGLSFFGIREMHILEPWHNLNRLEQVVGRGTRKFSHKKLEPEKQNLTVYFYAITTPKNNEETVDMQIYRKAEEKDLKITKIELLLKQNAIDCNLNKEGNFYSQKIWNQDVNIITSRGAKQKVKIHDKPYSRICHYQKNCQFKCIPDLKPLAENEIDKTSYSLKFFQDDIQEMMYLITKMYQYDIVYTLNDITDYVNQHIDFLDINALYKALDILVKHKIIFKDELGRNGRIVYQGNYYLFQPSNLDYDKTIYEHRRLPLTIKTNSVDLGNYIQQLRKDRMELMKKDQYDYDEILEKVEYHVDFILLNDIQSKFKTSLTVTDSEAFSITLDRLVYQYKNVLLKHIIKKKINNSDLTLLENKIIPHINDNLIYFKDVWDIKNDNIYGYKLIHNDKQIFYVFNNETHEFEQDQGNRNKILEKQRELIPELPPDNNIIGYLKFDKKDTPPSFKIRDIQNKDDIKNIRGTNCAYKGKNEIYKYIKILSGNQTDIDKGHKNVMCNDIELLLRRLEKKEGNKKRWFYNAEDYIATHHDLDI